MRDRMLIIGVSGKMHHGKDTVGDYLVEKHGFQRTSFGDKLKQIAMTYDNSTPERRQKSNELIVHELFQDRPVYEQVDKLMQSICPGMWCRLTYDDCYGSKPDHARRAMQLLGEGARQIWPECWINYTIEQCKKQGGRFVITDLRYKNEAFAIEMQPQAQLWRVQRDLPAEFGSDHISETNLDNYPFEVFIDNNGTFEELYEVVDKVIEPLLHGKRPFARGGEVY